MTKYLGFCEYHADDGHSIPATHELEDIRRMIPVCKSCYDKACDRGACSDPDSDDCRRGVTAFGINVER